MKLFLLGFLAIAAWAQDARAQGVSRSSDGNQPPRVVAKTEPEYTEEARRAGVNATILLRLVVNEGGVPEEVQVVRGAGFGLDEKAVETVQSWRFDPGTKQGQPSRTPIHVEVSFNLMDKDHQRQHASLIFTLPPDTARPELIEGVVPANPDAAADGLLRVHLTVSRDGKVENLDVIETTDQEWAKQALRKMKKWRFRTHSSSAEGAGLQGLFELTVGRPKRSSR